MQRFDVAGALAELVTEDDLFVSSIGELWHDWWNLRPDGADNTFSPAILGSVSSTALGLSVALPHRRVVALETDGSMLMNTGIMATLGTQRPSNLTVIVFDNEVYESIGAPPTLTAFNADLAKMAEGAGCINCETVRDLKTFTSKAQRLLTDDQFGYIVAKIELGTHGWSDANKKPTDGIEDKYRFIRHVEATENIVIHAGAPQA